eukprot:TRINITY_DN5576_c0_g4_i1.p1 TRINITY_DN5576_c0_g4~~TRINITY_DN5576_c0_g4_i1.p1  ORF type:complete len:505 (-),score=146.70 TRINITY_DN5576_c0_g4_i1:123-1637(-)
MENKKQMLVQDEPETVTEQVHSMKLSLEFPSIKGLPFGANIGIEYTLPLFQAKTFSTNAPIKVPKGAKADLKETFASYPFESTKSELYELLSTNELLININNFAEDLEEFAVLGTCRVPLRELIGSHATLERASHSTVRAYDTEIPIEDYGSKQIGTLRFVAYLEDFGAAIESNKENNPKVSNAPKRTPEYEALWQLEMWKKAEEIKFNAYLKEKELLYESEVVQMYKEKEQRRVQEFDEATGRVKKLQQLMTRRARELQKREQKLAILEDELGKKIGSVAKQLAAKEESIITIKGKCKEEKAKLEIQIVDVREQLAKAKEQLEDITDKQNILRKELDENSVNSLKQEISAKGLELIEQERKLEKSVQAKELYKLQYEKIKGEIIRMRDAAQTAKDLELKRQAEEIETLRYQAAMPRPQCENPPFKTLKTEDEQSVVRREEEPQETITLHNYQEMPEQLQAAPRGELERLMNEKRELLESGLYSEGDEIIRILNAQIAEIMKTP